MILELVLLALAISVDTLVAGFSYGISKVKIPWISTLLICFVDFLFFAISSVVGHFLGSVISIDFATWLSFALLLCVGIAKVVGSIGKIWLTRARKKNKSIKLKLFGFQLALNILAEANGDVNKDKILSPLEAVSMTAVLALDELGVGLGAGMMYSNFYLLIIFNLIGCFLSIQIGLFVGKKLSSRFHDLSWLGGVVLILLALSKLL